MKQVLIPKPNLQINKGFNRAQSQSLQILAYSNEELITFLKEQVVNNPFLKCSFSNTEVDEDAFLAYDHTTPSLYDTIMKQVHLSQYKLEDDICEYLLMQLDSNGYFKDKYEVLIAEHQYSESLLQHHIAILKTFEPIGCFSFSLKECLEIQCTHLDNIHKDNAYMICSYLEDVALENWDKLSKTTKLDKDSIQQAYTLIKTLNPKPAANYSQDAIFMEPEFKIEIENGKVVIALLNEDLQISFCADETKNDSREVRAFMKKQRQEVESMMSQIQKRNTTLLQIMQCICEIQIDFFLNGGNLKHCTLDMISKMCKLHISTVSRSISNKTCEFHQHYYALKSFLSSGGVATFSTQQIKDKIKKYIAEEDKNKPLSDEHLRQKLLNEGIPISRRAVSKYREACYIFNSIKRKRG
ncbi:MAG: RNA polymerase factor sigma-54 [Longicatena sp.]